MYVHCASVQRLVLTPLCLPREQKGESDSQLLADLEEKWFTEDFDPVREVLESLPEGEFAARVRSPPHAAAFIAIPQ